MPGECESTGQSRKANAGSEPKSEMVVMFRSGDLNLLIRPFVVGKMLQTVAGITGWQPSEP